MEKQEAPLSRYLFFCAPCGARFEWVKVPSRQLNKQLKIGGILITMVDNRTNYVRDISDLILDTYGNQIKIFPQSIPFSVRAAEISAEEISIFEHDPKGKVAAHIGR